MLGIIIGLCAALGFGSGPIFARLGLQHMRPTTGTLLSLVVGVIVTMSIALVLRWDEVFALIGVQVVVAPRQWVTQSVFYGFCCTA